MYPEDRRGKDDGTASAWPLCVALSGEVGTPSAAVAAEIGRRLGWPVHDDDILHRIADDLGINVATLESFDERRRSWLLECLESLSSRPNVGECVYVRHLVRELRGLAAAGRCVIVGRGAARASSVRVHPAPSAWSASARTVPTTWPGASARTVSGRSTSSTNSRKKRAAFVQDHFNRDPRNIRGYDLVVNSSNLQPAECAALIVEGVHQREAEPARARR